MGRELVTELPRRRPGIRLRFKGELAGWLASYLQLARLAKRAGEPAGEAGQRADQLREAAT